MSYIPISKPTFIGREKEYVVDCVDSTWISSSGKYIHLFEKRFAEYLGVKHAISCCNGTAALHLALLAVGVGSGDEVILPSLTYVATANAVQYTGATTVFADSEPDTWNIDTTKIEKLITPRTKAIIPVPLYGHPCDMDPVMSLAAKHGIYVVEDAAEALGAKYKGRLCGTQGDISTFSFYGNKIITCGEGGMVVTNDDDLAARVRLLKGQGMDPTKRYWFTVVGFNYRMTNIEAALGLAQLEKIDAFLTKRAQIACWYNQHLEGVGGITLPSVRPYAEHSWWMYSILIENGFLLKRDELMNKLFAMGIETRPFFYPMHTMPIYEQFYNNDLFISETIAAKGINLPTYYDLTEDDVVSIVKAML